MIDIVRAGFERGAPGLQVLPEATPESPPLCLYYPAGRNPPPLLRAFARHPRARK